MNLAPEKSNTGEHQVTIDYAQYQKELAVVAEEGKVSVVTFGLNRLFFLQKLRVKVEPQPFSFSSWKKLCGKLKLAEISFWGESQP